MERVFDYIEARKKERKYDAWSKIETSSGQFDTYRNYEGEVEARNAQTRENFTAGQRRNRTLRSTEYLDNDAHSIIRQINSKGREVYSQAVRADDAELETESKAWSKTVYDVISGKINKEKHIKVMNTPKVFNLIGVESLPVYTDAGKISNALNKHSGLTVDLIKQIPTAISDPIAIFKSATHSNDTIVVMTELIDKDGGTIIVPVQLYITQDSYKINRITSIYAKKNDKTGEIHNEWFKEQVDKERLLYINNKKSSGWSNHTKLQLLSGKSMQDSLKSIPNEKDLANLLKNNNPEIYSQAFNPKKSIAEWFRKSSAKIRDLITYSVESKPKTKERPSLSFENETSEKGYTENNRKARTPSPKVRLNNFLHKLVKSFSGDHANLNEKNLLAAKQEFRLLKQRLSAAAKQAMKTFTENLGGLDAYEKDLFGRAMFLFDHSWRKSQVPDAKLPFEFTDISLKKETERFQKLIDENPKVKKAIEAEQATNKKITREFLKYAHELGFEINDIFNNPYYYRHIVLEYADLAGLGANKDGWTPGNPKQSQYDKSAEYKDLMRQAIFGNGKKFSQGEDVNLSDIIPDGYELYSPAGSGLVKMANSVHENVIIQGLQDASDKYGIPLDEVLTAGVIDDEEIFNQLWVIPKAIKDTFRHKSDARHERFFRKTRQQCSRSYFREAKRLL